MRVLYIANAGIKRAAQRYYNPDKRFYNGLVRNGHDVWAFSDRDILRMESPLTMRYFGLSRVNKKLIETARNFRPQALVMGNADIITQGTLAQLRREHPDMRVALLNVDAIFNPRNAKKFVARSTVVDCQFFTTGGQAIGAFATETNPCYFMPNPVDASIDTGQAHLLESPRHDVLCTMSVDMRYRDSQFRQELALGLAKNLPHARMHYAGFAGNKPLQGHAYIDAYSNAAMALSLSQHISNNTESTAAQRYLYSSDRIAHVIGNGALALVSDMFGLQDLFAEDEMVFFSDLEDLTQKVRYYLAQPKARQEMAARAWRKAHAEMNETRVMRYVMERLFAQPLTQDYAWPTEAIFPAARDEKNAMARAA